MGFKVKNSQLNNETLGVLNQLIELDINASAAFRLTRIIKHLSSIVEDKLKSEKRIYDKWIQRDENGNPIEIEDKRLWAIKNITPTENGKLRIELYDRMEAIKMLHRIQQGDIPQKIEISTVEARESILEKLAKITGKEAKAGDKNEER